jgi:predicted N-acetyltransferase YhbS
MLKLDYLVNHPHLVQSVAELGLKEFGYLNPGQTVQDRINILQKHLNQDQLPIALVGLEDDKLVGTACLRETDIDSYTHVSPWLGSVIVVPEMRNKGIGSWLVHETMQFGKKLGPKEWYLYTPDRESFYLQLGWLTIDETTHQNISGKIMRLTFT